MSGYSEEPGRPANYAELAGHLIKNAEARLNEKSVNDKVLAESDVTERPSVVRLRKAQTGEHVVAGRKLANIAPSPKDMHWRESSSEPRRLLNQFENVCASVFIKFGPFEVRPGLHQELPIGRAYQPIREECVSRLQGFIGRDEHSLYIREVPDSLEHGLRPSKNGIWVRHAREAIFRRLAPGEAVRLYTDMEVRVGGDGKTGDAGFHIDVC